MSSDSEHETELNRLHNLASMGISLGEVQQELQPFVELARFITGAPACEINIIDAYQQWTVAGSYDEMKVIPREQSICFDTIQDEDAFEVHDLSRSDRYKERPYVKGVPHYKYYCGVQLTSSDDYNIGSICVLDTEPNEITSEQKEQLQLLADLIVKVVESGKRSKVTSNHLNELQDDFHKLNHDIRGPINGIIGLTELIKEGINSRDDVLKNLQMIENCASTIVEKIDTMLEKVSDTESLTARSVSLGRLTKRIMNLYKPQAAQKDIHLTVEFSTQDGEEARLTEYDAITLIQILGNLISNSLKFTEEDGRVEVEGRLMNNHTPRMFQAHVSDTGRGMEISKVDAFNEGEVVEQSQGTAGEKSFGIGLRHVRELVAESNGSISVSSTEGNGTRFELGVQV